MWSVLEIQHIWHLSWGFIPHAHLICTLGCALLKLLWLICLIIDDCVSNIAMNVQRQSNTASLRDAVEAEKTAFNYSFKYVRRALFSVQKRSDIIWMHHLINSKQWLQKTFIFKALDEVCRHMVPGPIATRFLSIMQQKRKPLKYWITSE